MSKTRPFEPRGRARTPVRGRAESLSGRPLKQILEQIDGGPWPRYREIVGRHPLGDFEVVVDRVPPDPFAGGARIRLIVDRRTCGLPDELAADPVRRVGVEDWLARKALRALSRVGVEGRGGPGSGAISLEPFGPAVIERSAGRVTETGIELRLFVHLPASGRRVRGLQAERLFFETLLRLATSTLVWSRESIEAARAAADNVEDHRALQAELGRRGLVAFVADGSRLARAAGDDERPRHDGREVAFAAPPELRVELDLPHAGRVAGMGIPGGVTLIVGGGFHGKSTLLDALAAGVYPHHAGDGRERVATLPQAVTIRAEDGRPVRNVDISGFLGDLPSGVRAEGFTTEKASGSTSQATAVVEALEAGARVLLLDEDRCATNFMIRDGRMQRLVPRPAEPIVPFLDRVRELYDRFGVSTVLVTGGSGDYLEVADTVIRMDAYVPRDVTADARRILGETRSMRLHEEFPPLESPASRHPRYEPRDDRRAPRAALRGPRAVRLGEETIDLRGLEQLVETAQVRTLSFLLQRLVERCNGDLSLGELVRHAELRLDEGGLDGLSRPVAYDLARPRPFELAAALNRWRALRFERPAS